MESFGEIIKYVRTSKNMSYVKLSKFSGISIRQIQKIEKSDIVERKLYTLESLSNALGVNLVEYALVFS
ncbi:MAG: helix-turn-helix domain-containing protein [Lachnospirales bacterium]